MLPKKCPLPGDRKSVAVGFRKHNSGSIIWELRTAQGFFFRVGARHVNLNGDMFEFANKAMQTKEKA
jgi:hypothetical protein